MPHHIIAEINLSEQNKTWLSNLRRQYSDLTYQQEEIYFSLGSPISDVVPTDMLVEYIKKRVFYFETFEYALRSTQIRLDKNYPEGNLVLIPDKGFSHLMRMHSMIYTYGVEPFMNRDVFRPYLPQVVIGRLSDVRIPNTIQVTREISLSEFEITGKIERLIMLKDIDGTIQDRYIISLSSQFG